MDGSLDRVAERVHNHGREIGELKNSLKEFSLKLDEVIKDMSSRPTWMTSNTISFLVAVIIALLGVVAKGIK